MATALKIVMAIDCLGYEVQHILGHTQVKTTQRYAHLSQDTLLAAANSATVALGVAMMPMVSASPAAQVQLVQ